MLLGRQYRVLALVLVCCLAETTCVAPPPLTHATNNFPFTSSIPIHDIVQRVKCDLTNALYERVYANPHSLKFAWMRNWTAKADLTLEVNESGGVTPSLSYTQPLANGFIFGTGPNSINTVTGAQTNVVGATPQNFILGATGTFNASATKTETLSFNLSMAELKDWKDMRQRLIGQGKELTGIYSCAPTAPTDLQAGLELDAWLEEVLKPVELGDLQTGIHPTPSQSGAAAVSSKSPPAAGTGKDKALSVEKLPNPTISAEEKAFLDLSLTTALTELEVPYDLSEKVYYNPADPTKACTTSSSEPGKSVTFRPPSYPSSNQNSLVTQSTTNAQTAQSSAAEVYASQSLDGHIKQKAWLAAREARRQSIEVQKAAQYAAQRILAVCEADTKYVNPDKCISFTAAADSKQAGTSVELSGPSNSPSAKVDVTLTATVSAPGTNTVPAGNVTFKEDDQSLGSGTLNRGVATISTSFNDPGIHLITAEYEGEGNFSGSTGTYKLTISAGTNDATMAVKANSNPSGASKEVTFTATVEGSSGTPTGKVTFRNGAIALGKRDLAGGKASYTTRSLAAGDQQIEAEYSGDTQYKTNKASITEHVAGGSSTAGVQLWSSANPSAAGQMVTFTARVSGAKGQPAPTGRVTFLRTVNADQRIPMSTDSIELKNGAAVFSTSSLPAATSSYSITATYLGDSNYNLAFASLGQYVVKSLSGAKYVVVQLSPYFCDGSGYHKELDLLSQNQLMAAERNADLAKQNAALAAKYISPDPPFESIGQSMSFVVTLGASTSPNWSFVRWKGPSNGGSLASVMGIRTHSLNIAMGPITGTTEVSRVLDNAATRQAIQGLQQ